MQYTYPVVIEPIFDNSYFAASIPDVGVHGLIGKTYEEAKFLANDALALAMMTVEDGLELPPPKPTTICAWDCKAGAQVEYVQVDTDSYRNMVNTVTRSSDEGCQCDSSAIKYQRLFEIAKELYGWIYWNRDDADSIFERCGMSEHEQDIFDKDGIPDNKSWQSGS